MNAQQKTLLAMLEKRASGYYSANVVEIIPPSQENLKGSSNEKNETMVRFLEEE